MPPVYFRLLSDNKVQNVKRADDTSVVCGINTTSAGGQPVEVSLVAELAAVCVERTHLCA